MCFRGWWISKLISKKLRFQGSHIKIKTNTEIPVQVDGEPWLQPPGDIVVLRSALKVNTIQISNFSSTHTIHFFGHEKLLEFFFQRHRWPQTKMYTNSNTIFGTVYSCSFTWLDPFCSESLLVIEQKSQAKCY